MRFWFPFRIALVIALLKLTESKVLQKEPLIFTTNYGTIIYVNDLRDTNSAKEIILGEKKSEIDEKPENTSEVKESEEEEMEKLLAIPTKIAAINASDGPDSENIYLLTYKSNNIDLWKLKSNEVTQSKILGEFVGTVQENVENVTKIEISADDQTVLTITRSDGQNSFVYQRFIKKSLGQAQNDRTAIIPSGTAITGNREGILAMNGAYLRQNSCLVSINLATEGKDQIFRNADHLKFIGSTCADSFIGDENSQAFHPVDIHIDPSTDDVYILTYSCKIFKKSQMTGKFRMLKENEDSDEHSFVGCKKLLVYDRRFVLVDSSDELKVFRRHKGLTDYEQETLELESNFIYLDFLQANEDLFEDKIVDACRVFSNN